MRRMGKTQLFLALMAFMPSAQAEAQRVVFDSLARGTQFGEPVGNIRGAMIFRENGVDVSIHEFFFVAGGDTFNFSEISDAIASDIASFGTENTMLLNNVNLKFDFTDFTRLGFSPNKVLFEFADCGGSENIFVNGDTVLIGEMRDTLITLAGGITVAIDTTRIFAPLNKGTVTLLGPVATFRIGGQELFLDNISARDTTRPQIEGEIHSAITGAPVSDFTVRLHDGATDSTGTDENGHYLFENLTPNLDYTVRPFKPPFARGDSSASITSLDAALINLFLSNDTTLTPAQRRAADVDELNGIQPFDAALISRFAAGEAPLPFEDHTGEWRFEPPQAQLFAVIADQRQDFGATLLGDVDGSWTPSPMSAPLPVVEQYAHLENLVVSAGKNVAIPLTVENQKVLSVDIDFVYEPQVLQFLSVTEEKKLNTAFQIVANDRPGRLRVSAYRGKVIKQSGPLLLLNFRVVGKPGSESRMILQRFQLNGGPVQRAEKRLVVEGT
ncbi:MAG: carboxypeptidase regulatory-like domain-containing protein [bacterium]